MKDITLIQGDSLALPRENTPYKKTWPYLLQERHHSHVVVRAQGEKTTADLDDKNKRVQKRELEYYKPTRIIIQLGVVDAAPRYLFQSEKELLHAFPSDFVSYGAKHIITRLRSRSSRRAYVSENDFERNLRQYLDRAAEVGAHNVIIIKILTAGEKYESKNPNVQNSIRKYNTIIDNIAQNTFFLTSLCPLADSEKTESEIVDEYTDEGGYHLNADGHALLFERLSEYF